MTYKSRRLLASILLGPLSLLPAGCGTTSSTILSTTTPSLTGNWQIQSGAAPTLTTAISGVALFGALSSSGSQVTGEFRLTNFAAPIACLNQVITVTGTIDVNRNLTLTSAPFNGSVVQVSLIVPPITTTIGAGTIAVIGGTCAVASGPAIGGLIAPVTGTYTGPLSVGPISATPVTPTATATLQLIQSATPGADGQFPVTANLQFVSGSCTATYQYTTGSASGVGLMFSAASLAPPLTTNVIATTLPTGTQVNIGYFFSAPAPCSTSTFTNATYSGTLTRQ